MRIEQMEKGTLIPDMNQGGFEEGMYTRNSADVQGTYIPEMHVSSSSSNDAKGKSTMANEKPVVGFLYSISRQGIGEYWPLHMGANTIGRDPKNEVQLQEQTVSEHHAVLNVRKMRTSAQVIASIQDKGSQNGIFLNDEELDYESHPCKNGDILTIGVNYQLLLLLINTDEYGLKVSENFTPSQQTKTTKKSDPFGGDMYKPHKPKMDDSTVDLGGASPFMSSEATKML